MLFDNHAKAMGRLAIKATGPGDIDSVELINRINESCGVILISNVSERAIKVMFFSGWTSSTAFNDTNAIQQRKTEGGGRGELSERNKSIQLIERTVSRVQTSLLDPQQLIEERLLQIIYPRRCTSHSYLTQSTGNRSMRTKKSTASSLSSDGLGYIAGSAFKESTPSMDQY